MHLALLRHKDTTRLEETRPSLAMEAILGKLDRPELKTQFVLMTLFRNNNNLVHRRRSQISSGGAAFQQNNQPLLLKSNASKTHRT